MCKVVGADDEGGHGGGAVKICVFLSLCSVHAGWGVCASVSDDIKEDKEGSSED